MKTFLKPNSIAASPWVATVICTVVTTIVGWASLSRLPTIKTELDFTRAELDRSWFARFEGWRPSREGLVAPPGEASFLLFSAYKSRFDELMLYVDVAEQGHGKVEVGMMLPPNAEPAVDNVPRADGESPPWQLSFGVPWEAHSASSLVHQGQPVNLTRLWPASGEFLLFAKPVGGAEGPLLRAIRFEQGVNRFAWLVLPAFAALAMVSCWHLLSTFPWMPPAKGCALATVLVCLASVLWPLGLMACLTYLAVGAAAGALLPGLLGRGTPRRPAPVIVALITFLAASLWWDALNRMRFEAPAPDAVGYRELALSMRWFYDTQFREPLYVFFVKIGQMVLGPGDTQVRAVTYAISIVLVPVMYVVGRELFDEATGIIAATLLASNSVWGWNSARGMRLGLFTLALMVVTWAIFTPRPPRLRRHVVWLGLASAAVCLVRITSLWFCLLGGFYALWKRSSTWRPFAAFAGLTILPLLPYVIYCAVEFGDPMYGVNYHIKFYRNIEFVGQPGMPTQEERAADAYAGSRASAANYVFGQHSLTELSIRTVRALEHIFIGDHARKGTADGNIALFWWMLGTYLVIAFTGRRDLLIWGLLQIGPIAWLYGEDFGPEARTVFHVSALTYLLMAHCLVQAVHAAGSGMPLQQEAQPQPKPGE